MKKKIDVFTHMNELMQALQSGVLLTAKAGGRVNPMAISWGMVGIEWNQPIFTTFVREHRFTRQLLEQNPEFTISVPLSGSDQKLIGLCGAKSGADIDKVREFGLTLEEPEVISVPGIKEYPLILECRVVYKQLQDKAAMPPAYREQFYPEAVDGSFHGANRDYHWAYYGEIVAAYIVE